MASDDLSIISSDVQDRSEPADPDTMRESDLIPILWPGNKDRVSEKAVTQLCADVDSEYRLEFIHGLLELVQRMEASGSSRTDIAGRVIRELSAAGCWP